MVGGTLPVKCISRSSKFQARKSARTSNSREIKWTQGNRPNSHIAFNPRVSRTGTPKMPRKRGRRFTQPSPVSAAATAPIARSHLALHLTPLHFRQLPLPLSPPPMPRITSLHFPQILFVLDIAAAAEEIHRYERIRHRTGAVLSTCTATCGGATRVNGSEM